MKKGVAVPYIIALILGIVVVALIGYWFFILGGGIPGQQSIAACNIVLQRYCNEWSKNNFQIGSEPTCIPSGKLRAETCVWDSDPAYPGSKGCKALGVVATDTTCRALFGTPGTTPTTTTTTTAAG